MEISMFIYREFKKCVHSLLLHRLRSLLSTLGILFGVVAVITMLSIGEGAKQEILEQIEQLGMNNIIVRQHMLSGEQYLQSSGLSLQDVESLHRNIATLRRIAPLKVVEAVPVHALLHISPEILAVTREFGEMKELQLSEGRFICALDRSRKKNVCVLGYEVAKELGKEGHVGRVLKIHNTHYEIVGVLKSTYWKASKNHLMTHRNLNKTIFIPLGSETSLMDIASLAKHPLSEIVLQMQNVQDVDRTVQLIKKILGKLHGGYEDYQIVIPQELFEQAYRTQTTFNLVLGSIAGISLLVGGIGIMNIMLANVSERTREIGIRRAVGANQRHILLQFLLETWILTLIGATLGILLGIALSVVISWFASWKTVITLGSLVLSLGMASIVGLCSGLYPAYWAAVMDPIQALRHD